MSNFLKNLVGIITVQSTDREITMGGTSLPSLARDIAKYWETTRINEYMFTTLKAGKISFPPFFAPEVAYVLEEVQNYRYRWSKTNDVVLVRNKLLEESWLKQTLVEPTPWLKREKLSLFVKTPLPHQTQFFDVYENRKPRFGLKGYMLSSAPGSGKTLTCLMTAEMVMSDFVVMIVPKNSVYRVWEKTLKEEYKKPQKYWISTDDTQYKGERFLVGHYEDLPTILEAARKLHGKVTVILDESHNMNEISSNRTQLFVELCKVVRAEDVLWSSGTPVKALGYEAIPLLRTIDPLFTQDVEERFKKIYGRSAKKALDILKHRMGHVSFRVEKSAVVDNKAHSKSVHVKIPDGEQYTLDVIKEKMKAYVEDRLQHYKDNFKSYERVYTDAVAYHEGHLKTTEQLKAFRYYQECFKTIRKGYDPSNHAMQARYCNSYELKQIMPSIPQPMREPFKGARSVLKYVELKVMGEALGNVVGKSRSELHVKMVPHIGLEKFIREAVKKTLIFTSYVSVVKTIDDYLKKLKFHPIAVHGETNDQLPAMVAQLEKNPDVNPAIATYQSLSTAVPLTMASTSIFVNSPFRDHEMEQAKARMDRLGQDAPVTFVHVYLDTGDKPNISTRAQDILEWSRAQISAIMGRDYTSKASDELEHAYVGSTESYALDEFFVKQQSQEDVDQDMLDLMDIDI